MSENILCVKNIKKSFGGVHALKGVDLTIKKGETHCLAGENGCGKSTIIKVISGFYKPDEGTIEIDGKGYTNMSTADAIAAGIQVIYQDFSIFPNLTVMENLAFNQVLAEKKKFVNKKEFRKIAEEAVRKINFDVDLDARVETLPVADKQLIAISRALLHNAKLIIMDEPTTALTKREVTRLFGIIEELKKEGITILFVSHKLDEVFEISDSITILRSGQNVYHCPASEMTEEKFTYYMTGRNIDTSEKKEVKDFSETEKVLEVKDLSAKGFEHINFDLHAGEILGIAGQLGSGRTELSLALFGMLKPTGGSTHKSSVKKSIVYNDAVEEALCFDWIDSTIRPLDAEHKIQRFTPRNPKSPYSQANKERLKWLMDNGMIHPKFEEKIQKVLSVPFVFPDDIIDRLKEDQTVWGNYLRFPETYKRIRIAYIEAARSRPEEFGKRLNHFICKTKENKTIRGFGGIEKYYSK